MARMKLWGCGGEVGEGRERRAVGYEVRGHGVGTDLVGP